MLTRKLLKSCRILAAHPEFSQQFKQLTCDGEAGNLVAEIGRAIPDKYVVVVVNVVIVVSSSFFLEKKHIVGRRPKARGTSGKRHTRTCEQRNTRVSAD